MQKSKMIVAALALTLLGSTAVLADNNKNHGNNIKWNHGKQVSADAHERNAERKAEKNARKHARWVKGHSFPREYRSSKYYVTDWHQHKLRKPPKDYRWYRADDDYVLVRRKDNVISEIINALQ
ncbi:MAG: hypothetical protein K0R10_2951 [Alphaproteobacteria bacterium]|jgi:Ni/Co efflux regulator RcnB|nr:hypothetical protein [Alphaproteobacteria bacterium]